MANINPSIIQKFIELIDTPGAYAGEALKALRVNAAGTAIEFYTPSAGGASDYLSALTGAEIAITTTATLTISRQHLATATSADYTVTLPAVSGNTGKFISLRISSTSTKLVTLKGDGAELIDGLNTRIMWKGEVAVLHCDGTSWTKIAGRSIPMIAQMKRSTDFTSLTNATSVIIPMNATVLDNTGSMADPSTNNRIDIIRSNYYRVITVVGLVNVPATQRILNQIKKNGADILQAEISSAAGGYPTFPCSGIASLAAGDYIQLGCYQNSGSTRTASGVSGTTVTMILVEEIVSW